MFGDAFDEHLARQAFGHVGRNTFFVRPAQPAGVRCFLQVCIPQQVVDRADDREFFLMSLVLVVRPVVARPAQRVGRLGAQYAPWKQQCALGAVIRFAPAQMTVLAVSGSDELDLHLLRQPPEEIAEGAFDRLRAVRNQRTKLLHARAPVAALARHCGGGQE